MKDKNRVLWLLLIAFVMIGILKLIPEKNREMKNSTSPQETASSQFSYDAEGDLIKEESFHNNTNERTDEINTEKTKETDTDNAADIFDEEMASKSPLLEYDSMYNLIRKTTYYSDGTINRVCEFDTLGCIIEESVYSNGKLYETYNYEFDSFTDMIAASLKNAQGQTLLNVSLEHQSEGHAVLHTQYLSEDGLTYALDFSFNYTYSCYLSKMYDSNDAVVFYVEVENERGNNQYGFQYDYENKAIREILYHSYQEVSNYVCYKVDPSHDYILEIWYDANGNKLG